MKLLSVAQCDEHRNELVAKTQAIIEAAQNEDRDLTSEEEEILADITDNQIPAVDAKRERFVKIDQAAQNRIHQRVDDGDVTIGNDGASLEPISRVTVPASNRVHGELKAFENNSDGEKEAYVTGRWFAANFLEHQASKDWLSSHGFDNSLSSGDNQGAGVLVPTEASRSIIRLVEQYGVIRRECSNEPMGSDRKVVPVRVSGMTAYPVAETTTANEGSNTGTKSEPTYKNIELVARKWKAWCKMSDEVNEDSYVSLGDQIAVESALAFAYAEDNAGFNGDSTSTYHGITGILNAVKAGSVKVGSGTAFSSLVMADFETMMGALPDFPGISPKWYISKEGYYASMHRLLMASGGNTATNLENGGRPVFLGLPVVFVNVMNKVLTAQASTRVALLGDLNMGVKFGDRRQVTMSLTDQRYWDEDQIAIKATERFDINVHSTGTASEEGCILALDTAAS